MLQPRRIAALALAQYSAKLHNEPCGKTVGYQFRQDSCKSSATRILFQTYGNFLQELLHGKMNAEWVIFDEYHERKADMDLLFAYLLKLQAASQASEQALGVKCLELGHPLYPVQILHQKPAAGVNISAGQGIESEVVRALRTLYRNNVWQTTLVFLPGKAEIAKCHTAASEALGDNVAEFLELYGGQDRETQDRIFEETERPRVIFTTNIAETSITVPNVTGVVDSGIERVSEYDDSEKVNVLRTLPISLQNAIQRSGRSGRTQNGCAIRLWTEDAEKHMPQGIVPEVLQIEPSELILQKAMLESIDERRETRDKRGFPVGAGNDKQGFTARTQESNDFTITLPTAIPEARERVATAMLNNFGMLQDGSITELGKRAIQTPISSIPLALILAKATSAADLPDLLLAAMAWIHSGTEFVQKSKNTLNLFTLASDTLSKAINVPREVSFTLKQLRDFRDSLKEMPVHSPSSHFMAQQLLAAFPDALATPSGNVYKLSNGNTIRLQVSEPPYALLALSMLRTGGGSKSELRVSLYAPVPKELLGGESENIRYELLWRSGQERFIGIEIHESESPNGDVRETSRKEILPQEASPKVLEKLKELTAEAWRDKLEKENWTGRYLTENIQTLLIKMRLAAKLYPEYGLPEFNDEVCATSTKTVTVTLSKITSASPCSHGCKKRSPIITYSPMASEPVTAIKKSPPPMNRAAARLYKVQTAFSSRYLHASKTLCSSAASTKSQTTSSKCVTTFSHRTSARFKKHGISQASGRTPTPKSVKNSAGAIQSTRGLKQSCNVRSATSPRKQQEFCCTRSLQLKAVHRSGSFLQG